VVGRAAEHTGEGGGEGEDITLFEDKGAALIVSGGNPIVADRGVGAAAVDMVENLDIGGRSRVDKDVGIAVDETRTRREGVGDSKGVGEARSLSLVCVDSGAGVALVGDASVASTTSTLGVGDVIAVAGEVGFVATLTAAAAEDIALEGAVVLVAGGTYLALGDADVGGGERDEGEREAVRLRVYPKPVGGNREYRGGRGGGFHLQGLP
jgi:hypothetical protein